MNSVAVFLVGIVFGIVVTIALAMVHIRRVNRLIDEFLDDEIVAPLRKTDAPRAYRFQAVYRALLQKLERLL